MTTIHCPRLDTHPAHEFIGTGWPTPGTTIIYDCPGTPVIEGGALVTHDCGERAQPADVRRCCSRCESTICPSCEPCRRVS